LKATVNFYIGSELIPNITDGAQLGLDPHGRYAVLRPPDELAKAAPTFDAFPLLWGHQPLDAARHPADLVVGATGTDSRFEDPWLRNSLVVWSQIAIDAIEDGIDNLSAAYRYTAVAEEGVFNGTRFRFRMTDIIGNHTACVVPSSTHCFDVPSHWASCSVLSQSSALPAAVPCTARSNARRCRG